jgi:hypothetical protein
LRVCAEKRNAKQGLGISPTLRRNGMDREKVIKVMARSLAPHLESPRDNGESVAAAALSALEAAGFAVVPVEPTEKMMEAGLAKWSNLRDIYAAMLAAAKEGE